jgi:uncharacterized membrane protein YdjX (TVP38/TMEM64 family)
MNKNLKQKLGIIYILCVGILLFVLFSYLDLKDLTDYSYIKNKSLILLEFKSQNFILFSFLFFIFIVIWILLLGFASPLALVAGYVFGKWYGTVISVISLSIGCTILYSIALYFLKGKSLEYLENKILKYKYFFNKNEFIYFFLFRFIGGGGLPFALQNILPVLFSMKIKNYFYATFLGIIPVTFVINALGSGIEKLIKNNESLSLLIIFKDPNIYFPCLGFAIVVLLSFLIKKKIFNKS